MDPIAVILVLLGIICMVGHSTVQKWALDNGALSRRSILIGQHLISAVILISAIFWWGVLDSRADYNWNFFLAAIALTTVANVFIQYANVRSLELGEMSLVKPIGAMTPGLVTVAALVLGEIPSWQGMVGITLIVLGTYIHTREGARTLREWFLPLIYLFLPSNFEELGEDEQKVVRRRRDALRWAFLAACLGSFGLIGDALVARSGNVGLGFAVQNVILALVFATGLSRVAKTGSAVAKLHWKPLVILGLFYGLHIVFVMTAFRSASVAYVGSLKRLAIILTMLVAWWILGEKRVRWRIWPAIMIAAGSVLLAFDGSISGLINRLGG